MLIRMAIPLNMPKYLASRIGYRVLTINVHHLNGSVSCANTAGNFPKALPLPDTIIALESVDPSGDVSIIGVDIDVVVSTVAIQTT